MAQLKADKLMVVPSTADGFRAAVSALRSGPLSGMPDGTTRNAQVANACLVAGILPRWSDGST